MISPDPDTDRTDREAVLALLTDTIESTHERIESADAETPEEQELLIKWIRALGYLSGQYRLLLNDEDLDELEDKVTLVEAVTSRGEDR